MAAFAAVFPDKAFEMKKVAEAFASTGISPQIRAEALPVEELAAIWKALERP